MRKRAIEIPTELSATEREDLRRTIRAAQDGLRVGLPTILVSPRLLLWLARQAGALQ